MTQEEMKQITDLVVEEVLVQMPTIVGNLMQSHAKMNKLNREFYEKYQEFQKHKDVVVSVIEEIEGKDLSLKYEDILIQAAPVIKERINAISTLDLSSEISSTLPSSANFPGASNGVI